MTNTGEDEILAAFGTKKETKTESIRPESPKGHAELNELEKNFDEFMKGEMNPPQAREESMKKDKEEILKAFEIKEPKPATNERRLSKEQIEELAKIKENYEKFMAGDGMQATSTQKKPEKKEGIVR